MDLKLNSVGKKFNKEWIFRNLTHQVAAKKPTAIIGPNGSGKSTLLQIIAGSRLPNEGNVVFQYLGVDISSEEIYRSISLVAPALSLPDDFTLEEFLRFHFKFKNLRSGYQLEQLPELFNLSSSRNKFIKNFSTGMKQRLKLGISFYADTPLLLLDEPATNLDKSGLSWYLDEVTKLVEDKMVLVCSNRPEEYSFCTDFIDILEHRK